MPLQTTGKYSKKTNSLLRPIAEEVRLIEVQQVEAAPGSPTGKGWTTILSAPSSARCRQKHR